MKKKAIVFDTNVLSIFAELSQLALLLRLLKEHDLYIPQAVLKELTVGFSLGHVFLQEALNLIGQGQPITLVSPDSKEKGKLKKLPSWMGLGEAESVVICKNRGWIFASNDGKVIHYCKHHATFCISFNDILAALWQSKVASKDEVREIIRQLEAGGRQIKAKAKILSD